MSGTIPNLAPAGMLFKPVCVANRATAEGAAAWNRYDVNLV